jgi:hypothetical protein
MGKLPPSAKHHGQHSRIVNEHDGQRDGPEHGMRLEAVENTFQHRQFPPVDLIP